jgi:hypothetical protein
MGGAFPKRRITPICWTPPMALPCRRSRWDIRCRRSVTDVLGEVAEVSAVLATQRAQAFMFDTKEILPVSAPDQVLVSGALVSGAPISVHYRGGMVRDGAGLLWEINGTKGDIRISGPMGHAQLVPLALKGAQGAWLSAPPRSLPYQHPPSMASYNGNPDIGTAPSSVINTCSSNLTPSRPPTSPI